MADTQSEAQTPQDAPEAPRTAPADQEAPKPEAPARDAEPAEDTTDWKAEARKWESRAKEHSKAAARLAEIEDANKTEAQRATEAMQDAVERAAKAEARALRREVALDPRGDGSMPALSSADAALLDGITDEDAMRSLAVRLATPAPQAPGNTAPLEGATPKQPLSDDRHAFVQGLIANARTQ